MLITVHIMKQTYHFWPAAQTNRPGWPKSCPDLRKKEELCMSASHLLTAPPAETNKASEAENELPHPTTGRS